MPSGYSTAALITASHLEDYKGRTVMFIGTLTRFRGKFFDLVGGNHPTILKVECRNDTSDLNVRIGMKLFVRCTVNENLSLTQCEGYSPTILGEGFDINMANASVAITLPPQFRHMFS